MPSIYDVPAESNVINTYVPIPFQEIVQAGTARQQRYEQGLAGLEQVQTESQLLRGIPGQDERYIKEQVIPTINEIAEKYINKDLSDPAVTRQISRDLRTNINRGAVNKIQESYKNYQKYLDTLSSMGAAGRTPVPELLTDPSKHSTLRSGVFSAIPEAALDIELQATEYFKNLGPQFLGAIEVDPVTGTRGLKQGVVVPMVSKRAEESVDNFLKTPEGSQLIRIQKARGDERSAEEIAYDELYKAGLGFVGSRVTGLIPGYGTQYEKQRQVYPSTEIEVNLPAQEISKERSKPKKFIKNIENQQEQLDKIQYEINTATNPAVKADKKQEYNKLQSKLNKDAAVLDQATMVADKEIEESKENILNELENTLLNKGISSDVVKNVINNPEAFETREVLGLIQDKFATNIYEDIYGVKPHTSYSEKLKFNDAIVNYNKKLRKLDKTKESRIKDILEVNLPKSLQESVIDIPPIVTTRGEGFVIDPRSGKEYPSDLSRIFENVTTLVNDQMVEWVGGEDDKKLKKFQEADKYHVIGISKPSDKLGPYIAVEALNKSKKDDSKFNPTGTYKVYLTTQSQIQAAVRDLYISGQIETARRLNYLQPNRDIEDNWNEPKNVPEGYNFDINLAPGIKVIAVKRGNGYRLKDPYTGNESPNIYTDKELLTKGIYDMRVENGFSSF